MEHSHHSHNHDQIDHNHNNEHNMGTTTLAMLCLFNSILSLILKFNFLNIFEYRLPPLVESTATVISACVGSITGIIFIVRVFSERFKKN